MDGYHIALIVLCAGLLLLANLVAKLANDLGKDFDRQNETINKLITLNQELLDVNDEVITMQMIHTLFPRSKEIDDEIHERMEQLAISIRNKFLKDAEDGKFVIKYNVHEPVVEEPEPTLEEEAAAQGIVLANQKDK
ncbi:MAG TPA: hypothetical protein VJ742_12925 [Nitrososphaera sp.]|nr:hypothetical protein [Nitrososphaera sp.]